MGDSKISALSAVTSLGGTDEAVLNVAGASKKITGANLASSVSTLLGLGSLATKSAVASADITDGTIVQADLATALITALTGSNNVWTVTRKTADTGRNTTTTIAADPHLAQTLTSGVLYYVFILGMYVSAAGGATPDMKGNFCEDATTRGSMFSFELSATEAAGLQSQPARNSSVHNFGTATSNRGFTMFGTYLGNGASASWQWAQNTSDGNDTTMLTGSILATRPVN